MSKNWDNRKTYDDRKQPDVWPIESDQEIAKQIAAESCYKTLLANRAK